MSKMKHVETEERYRELNAIKDPLLRQFEYFCVNLADVNHLNCTSLWPRGHQEDLGALSMKIPILNVFEEKWKLRFQKTHLWKKYLDEIRFSMTK